MRATSVLAQVLRLQHARILACAFEDDALVLDVKPTTRTPRCSGCFRPTRRAYDRRTRTWRHLDLAGQQLFLRYALRRVDCVRCGVRVELVPWAEPDSAFTRDFENEVAYFAQRTDQTTTSSYMRVTWRTVGRIVQRVVDRLLPINRLDGLTHIGVDELSYRRHHQYITIVVDHVSGRVVWAHDGKNADTLALFFAELGPERGAQLQSVTLDMSAAYIKTVEQAAPRAQITFDRFHVQRLVQDALDQLRREQVRQLKGTEEGRALKKTRYALLKREWNLSDLDHERLALVQKTNQPLYRGLMLKNTLAAILDRRQVHVAQAKLKEWIAWALRSRLPPFIKAARTIRRHLDGIVAYIRTRLTNAQSEGLNGKIRVITRRAYGFHDPASPISLIFLCCSQLNLSPVHR